MIIQDNREEYFLFYLGAFGNLINHFRPVHMRLKALIFFVSLVWCFNLNSQTPSPFGTGVISNQILGQLDDASVVFASNTEYGNFGNDQVLGAFDHPDSLLDDYTFDIYIPNSYDGTEPYGLITFINSGNNGGLISSWIPVLEEKKLILIAGDNIGNSIFVNIRNGVAWAGVYRMKELFNIDTTRIYTSGNSGGGRMSTVLAYIYPEWIKGAVPNCGSSYLREVDQDYETQNPNSHYEYTYPFTQAEMEYVLTFDQKMGIMTSYDDFREGDIMNIYHNGMEEDQYIGKILETSGPHCSTSTQHFLDAVNFIEHPRIVTVRDSMDTTFEGEGFSLENAEIEGEILTMYSSNGIAKAFVNNLFLWNDEHGAILSSAFCVDSVNFERNTLLNFGLWDIQDGYEFCESSGLALEDTTNSINISFDFSGDDPIFRLRMDNSNQSFEDSLIINGIFTDWDSTETIRFKYHLWDNELRIEFSHHLTSPYITTSGVKLLDDDRSIRIVWDDISGNSFWSGSSWTEGAAATFTAQPEDGSSSSEDIWLDFLEIIVADTAGLSLPEHTNNELTLFESNDSLMVDNSYDGYQWYLDGQPILGEIT